MENTKYLTLSLVSFCAGIFIMGQLFALSSVETSLIFEEQEYSKKYTGEYFTDHSLPGYSVNTYTAPCEGFYIVEETPTKIESIGFGDLADQYTYTRDVITEKIVPTTSPDILESPTL